MAIVELQKRDSHVTGYEHKEVIADGQNGDTIRIFPLGLGLTRITCRVIAGAGTGKFQFTTSPDADVLDDSAVWSDWPKGSATGTEWDVLQSQVTGLRGVSISGEITIEVVI